VVEEKEWGKGQRRVFVKTNAGGGPYWNIGGLTQTYAGSGRLPPSS